jgi:hypothetical protein
MNEIEATRAISNALVKKSIEKAIEYLANTYSLTELGEIYFYYMSYGSILEIINRAVILKHSKGI